MSPWAWKIWVGSNFTLFAMNLYCCVFFLFCLWSSSLWCRTLEWLLTAKILTLTRFLKNLSEFLRCLRFHCFIIHDSCWEHELAGNLQKIMQLRCSELSFWIFLKSTDFYKFCNYQAKYLVHLGLLYILWKLKLFNRRYDTPYWILGFCLEVVAFTETSNLFWNYIVFTRNVRFCVNSLILR